MKQSVLFAFFILLVQVASAQSLPPGFWPLTKSQPLLDKTQTILLSTGMEDLSEGERKAISKLNKVGAIFQSLYEMQRNPQSASSLRALKELDRLTGSSPATKNLLMLYRLFQGPVGTTPENQVEAFLPLDSLKVFDGLYPGDATQEELDAFMEANPETREDILHPRTVVRRATSANITADLKTLQLNPVLDVLHMDLKTELKNLQADGQAFYAVPYSIAYAEELLEAYTLLQEAATAVENDDPEFAGYLRNRSRDLLSNDYESGDASWVTGHFKNINAQIGSYETYDDPMYGVKTFFSLNVLKRRKAETVALNKALGGLQELENSLPYPHHKRVKEDISVGVFDVMTDFAQSRGGNTATILPNESMHSRRYGRTILIRANILQNPELFDASLKGYQVAVDTDHRNDLTPDGNFYRVLWHEIGHYLGVDRTKDDAEIDATLQENADIYEELKADLVSLYVTKALHSKGYYTDEQFRSVYASGIRRVLQTNKPRRSQAYNTMQLMQWNFFMEHGLLVYNQGTQKLSIDYAKYHEVVTKMLTLVLDLQYQGDKAATDRFIEKYTSWDEQLHGAIAKNMRDQQAYRYRLFKYAALGD